MLVLAPTRKKSESIEPLHFPKGGKRSRGGPEGGRHGGGGTGGKRKHTSQEEPQKKGKGNLPGSVQQASFVGGEGQGFVSDPTKGGRNNNSEIAEGKKGTW